MVVQYMLLAGIVVALVTIVVAIYLVILERTNDVRQREAADAYFAAQRRPLARSQLTGRDAARTRVDQRTP
jgi:hypothetical protein